MGHQMLGINVARNVLEGEVELRRKRIEEQRGIGRINGMRSFCVEFIRNKGCLLLLLLT